MSFSFHPHTLEKNKTKTCIACFYRHNLISENIFLSPCGCISSCHIHNGALVCCKFLVCVFSLGKTVAYTGVIITPFVINWKDMLPHFVSVCILSANDVLGRELMKWTRSLCRTFNGSLCTWALPWYPNFSRGLTGPWSHRITLRMMLMWPAAFFGPDGGYVSFLVKTVPPQHNCHLSRSHMVCWKDPGPGTTLHS
jgi:hypothetical protein